MMAAGPPLLFGISIDPAVGDPGEPFERARLADELGIDLIMSMDHPYNYRLYETWTLLSGLAAVTERVHVGTNVANLPLRPPAMLAKQAATLDVLSGGRVDLGLGAGAYWDGIAAYGGPRRSPGEAYAAFRDALHIIRGMWENAGGAFTYEGEVYSVRGARPGPAPAHPIRIWAGAYGPRMLRLTGRMADGLIVSRGYAPPVRLPEINALVDEGAEEAGRDPAAVRRAYNLTGSIGPERPNADGLHGPAGRWIDELSRLHAEHRLDTFIFWPSGPEPHRQMQAFAGEVIPGVRERV
jgi:alkanesulfonate monooxygenase SsuD/methylene tetrahydromethanopterin reductase-like flavin-dependent oxidoreductase (luciferase family)